jgi:hypothetical protein
MFLYNQEQYHLPICTLKFVLIILFQLFSKYLYSNTLLLMQKLYKIKKKINHTLLIQTFDL